MESNIIKYQAHEIDFGEDRILAVQDQNGTVLVPIKRLCENIGLDFGRQQKKLNKDPSFSYGRMSVTGADGKTYKMGCLPKNQVKAWFFTINPNKIRADLRPKLLLYRADLIIAIDKYCSKGIAINPRISEVSESPIALIGNVIEKLATQPVDPHQKRLEIVTKRTNYFVEMSRWATDPEQELKYRNIAITIADDYWDEIRPPSAGLIPISIHTDQAMIHKLLLEGWCLDKLLVKYPQFRSLEELKRQLRIWNLPLPKKVEIPTLAMERRFLCLKNAQNRTIDEIIYVENVPRKLIEAGIQNRESYLAQICMDNHYPFPFVADKKAFERMWSDYMHSIQWSNITHAFKEEYQYTCWECGLVSPTDMKLHHLTYDRRGHEIPQDFSVLCVECHTKHHPNKAGKK